MVRVGSLAVAGVLAVQAASAIAADMPGTTLPPPQPLQLTERRTVVPDLNSGWYLRGDLGAHWGILNSAQSAPGFADPTDSTLNQVITGGLGAGIKSGWLRTDVTIDYAAPMKYQGSFASTNDTTAKIQATTALLNGYLDLGTWYHATPYIGGGAGVAYARTTDYVSGGAPPFSDATDKTQWNFAWAGMAGVAYAISHNMMLDVGYRYLNIGNVSTGSDAFGAMTFKNVAAHEVRVGLRWSFDELRYVQ